MLQVNFASFPTLTTERLTLRQMSRADAPALFILRADPEVMKYIPRPLAQSLDDVVEYIDKVNEMVGRHELINWGVTLRDDSQIIGTIGYVGIKPEHYCAEVGYMLRPDLQGTGLMQEALTAVLDYGFQTLHLHSVEALIDPDNMASACLLERNRFVKEGHFKENEFWDGKFLDTVYYSLLESNKR